MQCLDTCPLGGWMDQDLFYSWLEQSFIPEIERHHVPKPVLLLIDGVNVHVSLFISKLCDDNNIILCTYLPNSMHLLQVLDLELMGLVKMTYRHEVWKWLSNSTERSHDKLAFMEVFRIVLISLPLWQMPLRDLRRAVSSHGIQQ